MTKWGKMEIENVKISLRNPYTFALSIVSPESLMRLTLCWCHLHLNDWLCDICVEVCFHLRQVQTLKFVSLYLVTRRLFTITDYIWKSVQLAPESSLISGFSDEWTIFEVPGEVHKNSFYTFKNSFTWCSVKYFIGKILIRFERKRW